MKRKLFTVLLTGMLTILAHGYAPAKEPVDTKDTALKYLSDFKGGKLYRAGKIKVVELRGDYRQMGRQYGTLLKEDLEAMHHAIGEVFVEKRKMSPDQLATIAQAIFDRYPQRYKEILYGIADTSGLGRDKVILINAVEWFPKISHLSFGHCSGIAAWGPYTKQGPLVFGRNDDDDPLYLDLARIVVAVFKPNDGSIPTALINYAGTIYNATGMNADGLFIELNAGPWQGFSLERVSIFTTLFSYLQEYHNLAEFDRAMRSTLVDISSIINVADPSRAYSYECSLWDTRRRDQDEEGIIAAANAFSLPGWNISPIDPKRDPELNQVRKDNLLALGAKHKGAISPDVMMAILDVSIPDGGATQKGTILQVVAVPEQLKIWLKVPGLQNWTEIQLKPLFRS
ncbi:MAG: C45 family autoproteolytic acyltransferase/hydrolase [Deltaproteobacteria bacterium]|nr:C45 family autoproteolytic acyltransferase/hydrolase [Deltaproteobacteria bacterium]